MTLHDKLRMPLLKCNDCGALIVAQQAIDDVGWRRVGYCRCGFVTVEYFFPRRRSGGNPSPAHFLPGGGVPDAAGDAVASFPEVA